MASSGFSFFFSCSVAFQEAQVPRSHWKQNGARDLIPCIFSDSLLIGNTKSFSQELLSLETHTANSTDELVRHWALTPKQSTVGGDGTEGDCP